MKTASEMEKELQQSFKVFDVNGDGFINASELRQAMTTIGEKMTEKDINNIIKQWDTDGDGKIDYKGYFTYYAAYNVLSVSVAADSSSRTGIFTLMGAVGYDHMPQPRATALPSAISAPTQHVSQHSYYMEQKDTIELKHSVV